MRDYWLTQYLLAAVGWTYIVVCLVAIALALWLPKRWWAKVIALTLVIGIASILPRQAQKEVAQQQVVVDDYKVRLAKAQALFDERCKTAGEKIYKTVENVEGVLLKKIRPDRSPEMRADRMWVDAALPDESVGDWYLISFLGWEQRFKGNPGSVNIVPTEFPGYQYVDVQSEGLTTKRYILVKDEASTSGWSKLAQVDTAQPKARYAIDFQNPIDLEARQHWIAETLITITDTASGQILGERRSFALEPGLGSTAGFRSPWGFAIGCPKSISGSQTRNFAEKVLKLNQGK